MFFGFDLKEIVMFPVKDQEARKHFLIACLVALSTFIIPILPSIVLFGYAVRIAKQVLNNESPRMVEWDDLGEMAKDGLKVFGIRTIFLLPLLLILIPLLLIMVLFPILMSAGNNSNIEQLLPIFMLFTFGGFCILIPLSIPLNIITSAAEIHVIEKNEFSAGFRFKEWWPIFRANLSGFIAAFGIFFITTFVLSFISQIIYATLILACLLIVIFPATMVISTLIIYVTAAQAYRDGKVKLAQKEIIPQAS